MIRNQTRELSIVISLTTFRGQWATNFMISLQGQFSKRKMPNYLRMQSLRGEIKLEICLREGIYKWRFDCGFCRVLFLPIGSFHLSYLMSLKFNIDHDSMHRIILYSLFFFFNVFVKTIIWNLIIENLFQKDYQCIKYY